ncbi:MAG: saccharopine dehydrogenase NADP-binding domain-containing protein [Acidobacteria bacterium]|nr:saccharopine dehydrogenase NADP-binding domain-containing protein [Acidobacteriota bacterium]
MSKRWLIYGAYGFTGKLIVTEALRKGMRPVIAGRDPEQIEKLASATGLEGRAFALDEGIDREISDVELVLHCAGPFEQTSAPMVSACIRGGVSYLDITGEIEVFEAIMRLGAEAKDAGIVMIPGVGFDVVPTDCLAAKLAEDVADASHLDLAFSSKRGGISRGTLKTMIEGIGKGGAIRKEGRIVRVPVAWDSREIPYESGPRSSMTIPWGDVSTAFHTTGIPNVRVYTATHPKTIRRMRMLRWLLPVVGLPPVKWLLLRIADRRSGPDETERGKAHIELWGEALNASGVRRSRTMRIPEGYTFTAASAVLAAERVMEGGVEPGAWTPARAFGARFVDDVVAEMAKA